jgi:hypothetical protein
MSGVTDKDLGFDRIMRDLETLGSGADVYVGIRQAKGEKPAGLRKADGTVTNSDATIAEIATWNEFGVTVETDDGDQVKIPERSFLRSTMDENVERYTDLMGRQLGQVIDGEQTPKGAFKILGAAGVRDVQMKIRKGVAPANAPSTIARKGSSKPLIDTGRMRQSIDYQVDMGGKEAATGGESEAA